MADSLFILISQPSADALAAESLVAEVFRELGRAPPRLSLRRNDDVAATSLITSFLIFEGEGPNDFCSASISEAPIEITKTPVDPIWSTSPPAATGSSEAPLHMLSASTREAVYFNDSGVFDGLPRLDADSLREALLADPP